MANYEDQNVQAYRLLLRIEVVLREIIKTCLEEQYGVKWQRQIEKGLRQKIHESQTDETKRPQFDFLRLGALYYLTLGELTEIVKKASSQPCLAKLGADAFVKQLENVLMPRNAVAHTRSVSSSGMACISALYKQMESALSTEQITYMLENPDAGIRQCEAIPAMIAWSKSVLQELQSASNTCSELSSLEETVSQYWWGDDDIAGFDCQLIERVANIVGEYNSLPYGIGSDTYRLQFVTPEKIQCVQLAIKSLENTLA